MLGQRRPDVIRPGYTYHSRHHVHPRPILPAHHALIGPVALALAAAILATCGTALIVLAAAGAVWHLANIADRRLDRTLEHRRFRRDTAHQLTRDLAYAYTGRDLDLRQARRALRSIERATRHAQFAAAIKAAVASPDPHTVILRLDYYSVLRRPVRVRFNVDGTLALTTVDSAQTSIVRPHDITYISTTRFRPDAP